MAQLFDNDSDIIGLHLKDKYKLSELENLQLPNNPR